MAASLGSLVVSLGLDAAQFTQGLNKAQYELQKLNGQIQGFSNSARNILAVFGIGFGVDAFVGLISGAIQAQDHLDNLAKSSQVAADTLGGLGFASKQTGGGVDEMAQAFKRFNVNLASAAAGSEKEQDIFAKLGISLKDLKTLSPEQLFIKTADAFASFNESAKKAALGNAAFGKAYQTILPTLDQGSAKLQENIDFYKKYSGVTAETIAQAHEFTVEQTKLGVLFDAFKNQLVADLLPALQGVTKAFIDIRTNGGDFKDFAGDVAGVLVSVSVAAIRTAEFVDNLGVSIGALAARAGAVFRGDFKAAFDTIPADEQAVLERLHANADKLVAGLRNTQGQAPVKTGGGRDAPGLAQADSAGLAKKLLDVQLAQLNTYIKSEQDLLKHRESFLQEYYQHDELGIAEYFTARGAVIDEATANQLAALAKEQAAIEDFIRKAKPTDRADAEKQLEGVIAHRAQIEQDASYASIKNFTDQRYAVEAFTKNIEELSIKVADLRGDTVGAAAFGFDLQNKALIDRINLEKQSNDLELRRKAEIGDALINELRQRTIQQAQLNKVTSDFNNITVQVGIDQARVDLLVQTGAITEIDAINKRADVARQYIGILSTLAATYQARADALPKGTLRDNALLEVQKLHLAIDQLAAATDVLAKKFNDVFSGAISDAIVAVVDRTKSLKQAVLDAAKTIESAISKIAADQITGTLFAKGGALGGVGDFFAGIFGGGKSLTGASGAVQLTTAGATLTTAGTGLSAAALALQSAAVSLSAGGASSSVAGLFGGGPSSDVFGSLGGLFGGLFAAGGDPPLGRASIVGERGPELFVPRSRGTIIPNSVLQAHRQARNITVNVNVPQGTSTASATQIALETSKHLKRSQRFA